MTVFIKINEAESLNIKAIQSFTASEWKKPKQPGGFPGIAIAGSVDGSPERETVLTIVSKDGKQLSLCGTSADTALAILHQYGF